MGIRIFQKLSNFQHKLWRFFYQGICLEKTKNWTLKHPLYTDDKELKQTIWNGLIEIEIQTHACILKLFGHVARPFITLFTHKLMFLV